MDPLLGSKPLSRSASQTFSGWGEGFLAMKRENRRVFKELAYFSSLGISVSLAVFIGLGIGVLLDRKFDTTPWCTLIFLVLGIIAGFRNIARVIKRARKL
jgi:ATP synthase protein I